VSEVPLYTHPHLNILHKRAAGVPQSGECNEDSCTCRVDGGVPRAQEHTPISPNKIIDVKRARMETEIDNLLTLPSGSRINQDLIRLRVGGIGEVTGGEGASGLCPV